MVLDLSAVSVYVTQLRTRLGITLWWRNVQDSSDTLSNLDLWPGRSGIEFKFILKECNLVCSLWLLGSEFFEKMTFVSVLVWPKYF